MQLAERHQVGRIIRLIDDDPIGRAGRVVGVEQCAFRALSVHECRHTAEDLLPQCLVVRLIDNVAQIDFECAGDVVPEF